MTMWASVGIAAPEGVRNAEHRVAVLDPETSVRFDKELSYAVSEAMRSEIRKSGYEVSERDKTKKAMNEQECRIDSYSGECFVKLGSLLDVGRIITGNVVYYGKLYYLFFVIVDAKTGLVENIADDACDENGIMALARNVATRLTRSRFYFLEPNPQPGWSGVKEINAFFLTALEDPRRRALLKPEMLVGRLPIEAGDAVADLGAGSGFYTTLFSKKVGDEGTVYAVDVETDMLGYIENRARKEGLRNVRTVRARRDDPGLAPDSIDLAFLSYVYVAIPDREKYFRRIREVLRERGRLVIVDYQIPPHLPLAPLSALNYGPVRIDPSGADSFLVVAGLLDIDHIKNPLSSVGSSFYVRVPKEKVIEEVTRSGFALSAEYEPVPYVYCLLFSRDDPIR